MTIFKAGSGDRTRCAYCGESAVSVDHIPPKNLFQTNRTGLITVPSCKAHNNDQSELDEQFRNTVAANLSRAPGKHKELWEKTARGLQRRPKWRDEIFETAVHMPWSNETMTVSDDVHTPMIKRITRGLYWHHFGVPLPAECKIEVYRVRPETPMASFMTRMNQFKIADGAFHYGYEVLRQQHPTVGCWAYDIHEWERAFAFTDIAMINVINRTEENEEWVINVGDFRAEAAEMAQSIVDWPRYRRMHSQAIARILSEEVMRRRRGK